MVATNLLSNLDSIEARTQEYGSALLEALRQRERRSISDWVYEQLMELTTSDEALRVELLHFVDALPALQSSHAVSQHLIDSLSQPNVKLPPGVARFMQWLGSNAITELPVAGAARIGAGMMARRFIAGRNAEEAAVAVQRLRRHNMAFTLDLLGEAVISESEAVAYQKKYLEVIDEMAAFAHYWEEYPATDLSPFGTEARVNVSLKLSSLFSRFDPMAADATAAAVKTRLRPILSLARERGAFVYFDMEQYAYRSMTRRIFQEILEEDEFAQWPDVGIVVQAYLRDAEEELERLRNWAETRGTPISIRLVKGAYWDYETIVALQHGHPIPVFNHKAETDANFEYLTEVLLQNWQILRPAIATHNVRSAAHAQAVASELDLPLRAVEFQVLYGMGEPIGRALASQGERVRVYVPFGELLPGMAYLVRRLLENTSNDSFIRQVELDDIDEAVLLASPTATHGENGADESLYALPATSVGFRNGPETDFSFEENQQRMHEALAAVRTKLGETVPVNIGGYEHYEGTIVERTNPADKREVVARVCWAAPERVQDAIDAAATAYPAWRDAPIGERAGVLRRVAAEFRNRRFEIAAWEVFETGKPWRDADGDVAEAIDYCEFYAAEMERLAQPRRRDVPGELNEYHYDARGPAAIIAPWNFPLAILTGMAMAALVAGNPILLKPAEQSSRIGLFLMEALMNAGLPRGVASFLPGEGESIGPVLVDHPAVAIIAFTGSRAVGLSILESAGRVRPGQPEVKRVIAEMGGKNAIIIDADADLDEAVAGVIASAFGYSGQKCSACSRVIVLEAVYHHFCHRLAEAVKSIRIAPAEDPASTLVPLIDESSQERVHRYIEIGKTEADLLTVIPPPPELAGQGNYVPAAVFTDCAPEGRLWQEEIFGPILAVRRANDLDDALEMALDSEYALTGGFYSRTPGNIARVRREFRVGNLYINRKITGALVDRQPFGGARMSGTGTKAGGPDYLQHFLIPRAVTESVMRRGFAPHEESADAGI